MGESGIDKKVCSKEKAMKSVYQTFEQPLNK